LRKKIGLALGGGGARGWAHVGVLRALEEADLKIDYLAGTSIGALVGASYVAGQLPQLEALADEINIQMLLSLMDVSFPGLGLLNGEQVRHFLAKYVLDQNLEDSAIPFRCVATNFLLKEEVVFTSGNVIDAVRASISMPGIFDPFRHQDDIYLVDGGVVNPVPVSVVKAMGAEIIVAVNLNNDEDPQIKETSSQTESESRAENQTQEWQSSLEKQRSESGIVHNLVGRYEALKEVLQDQIDDWIPDSKTGLNIFDVIGNSMNIMEQRITQINLATHPPDVLIEPELLQFGVFDFHQAQPMIQKGYDAAQAAIPQLKDCLAASE
jgi:NTE family protein